MQDTVYIKDHTSFPVIRQGFSGHRMNLLASTSSRNVHFFATKTGVFMVLKQFSLENNTSPTSTQDEYLKPHQETHPGSIEAFFHEFAVPRPKEVSDEDAYRASYGTHDLPIPPHNLKKWAVFQVLANPIIMPSSDSVPADVIALDNKTESMPTDFLSFDQQMHRVVHNFMEDSHTTLHGGIPLLSLSDFLQHRCLSHSTDDTTVSSMDLSSLISQAPQTDQDLQGNRLGASSGAKVIPVDLRHVFRGLELKRSLLVSLKTNYEDVYQEYVRSLHHCSFEDNHNSFVQRHRPHQTSGDDTRVQAINNNKSPINNNVIGIYKQPYFHHVDDVDLDQRLKQGSDVKEPIRHLIAVLHQGHHPEHYQQQSIDEYDTSSSYVFSDPLFSRELGLTPATVHEMSLLQSFVQAYPVRTIYQIKKSSPDEQYRNLFASGSTVDPSVWYPDHTRVPLLKSFLDVDKELLLSNDHYLGLDLGIYPSLDDKQSVPIFSTSPPGQVDEKQQLSNDYHKLPPHFNDPCALFNRDLVYNVTYLQHIETFERVFHGSNNHGKGPRPAQSAASKNQPKKQFQVHTLGICHEDTGVDKQIEFVRSHESEIISIHQPITANCVQTVAFDGVEYLLIMTMKNILIYIIHLDYTSRDNEMELSIDADDDDTRDVRVSLELLLTVTIPSLASRDISAWSATVVEHPHPQGSHGTHTQHPHGYKYPLFLFGNNQHVVLAVDVYTGYFTVLPLGTTHNIPSIEAFPTTTPTSFSDEVTTAQDNSSDLPPQQQLIQRVLKTGLFTTASINNEFGLHSIAQSLKNQPSFPCWIPIIMHHMGFTTLRFFQQFWDRSSKVLQHAIRLYQYYVQFTTASRSVRARSNPPLPIHLPTHDAPMVDVTTTSNEEDGHVPGIQPTQQDERELTLLLDTVQPLGLAPDTIRPFFLIDTMEEFLQPYQARPILPPPLLNQWKFDPGALYARRAAGDTIYGQQMVASTAITQFRSRYPIIRSDDALFIFHSGVLLHRPAMPPNDPLNTFVSNFSFYNCRDTTVSLNEKQSHPRTVSSRQNEMNDSAETQEEPLAEGRPRSIYDDLSDIDLLYFSLRSCVGMVILRLVSSLSHYLCYRHVLHHIRSYSEKNNSRPPPISQAVLQAILTQDPMYPHVNTLIAVLETIISLQFKSKGKGTRDHTRPFAHYIHKLGDHLREWLADVTRSSCAPGCSSTTSPTQMTGFSKELIAFIQSLPPELKAGSPSTPSVSSPQSSSKVLSDIDGYYFDINVAEHFILHPSSSSSEKIEVMLRHISNLVGLLSDAVLTHPSIAKCAHLASTEFAFNFDDAKRIATSINHPMVPETEEESSSMDHHHHHHHDRDEDKQSGLVFFRRTLNRHHFSLVLSCYQQILHYHDESIQILLLLLTRDSRQLFQRRVLNKAPTIREKEIPTIAETSLSPVVAFGSYIPDLIQFTHPSDSVQCRFSLHHVFWLTLIHSLYTAMFVVCRYPSDYDSVSIPSTPSTPDDDKGDDAKDAGREETSSSHVDNLQGVMAPPALQNMINSHEAMVFDAYSRLGREVPLKSNLHDQTDGIVCSKCGCVADPSTLDEIEDVCNYTISFARMAEQHVLTIASKDMQSLALNNSLITKVQKNIDQASREFYNSAEPLSGRVSGINPLNLLYGTHLSPYIFPSSWFDKFLGNILHLMYVSNTQSMEWILLDNIITSDTVDLGRQLYFITCLTRAISAYFTVHVRLQLQDIFQQATDSIQFVSEPLARIHSLTSLSLEYDSFKAIMSDFALWRTLLYQAFDVTCEDNILSTHLPSNVWEDSPSNWPFAPDHLARIFSCFWQLYLSRLPIIYDFFNIFLATGLRDQLKAYVHGCKTLVELPLDSGDDFDTLMNIYFQKTTPSQSELSPEPPQSESLPAGISVPSVEGKITTIEGISECYMSYKTVISRINLLFQPNMSQYDHEQRQHLSSHFNQLLLQHFSISPQLLTLSASGWTSPLFVQLLRMRSAIAARQQQVGQEGSGGNYELGKVKYHLSNPHASLLVLDKDSESGHVLPQSVYVADLLFGTKRYQLSPVEKLFHRHVDHFYLQYHAQSIVSQSTGWNYLMNMLHMHSLSHMAFNQKLTAAQRVDLLQSSSSLLPLIKSFGPTAMKLLLGYSAHSAQEQPSESRLISTPSSLQQQSPSQSCVICTLMLSQDAELPRLSPVVSPSSLCEMHYEDMINVVYPFTDTVMPYTHDPPWCCQEPGYVFFVTSEEMHAMKSTSEEDYITPVTIYNYEYNRCARTVDDLIQVCNGLQTSPSSSPTMTDASQTSSPPSSSCPPSAQYTSWVQHLPQRLYHGMLLHFLYIAEGSAVIDFYPSTQAATVSTGSVPDLFPPRERCPSTSPKAQPWSHPDSLVSTRITATPPLGLTQQYTAYPQAGAPTTEGKVFRSLYTCEQMRGKVKQLIWITLQQMRSIIKFHEAIQSDILNPSSRKAKSKTGETASCSDGSHTSSSTPSCTRCASADEFSYYYDYLMKCISLDALTTPVNFDAQPGSVDALFTPTFYWQLSYVLHVLLMVDSNLLLWMKILFQKAEALIASYQTTSGDIGQVVRMYQSHTKSKDLYNSLCDEQSNIQSRDTLTAEVENPSNCFLYLDMAEFHQSSHQEEMTNEYRQSQHHHFFIRLHIEAFRSIASNHTGDMASSTSSGHLPHTNEEHHSVNAHHHAVGKTSNTMLQNNMLNSIYNLLTEYSMMKTNHSLVQSLEEIPLAVGFPHDPKRFNNSRCNEPTVALIAAFIRRIELMDLDSSKTSKTSKTSNTTTTSNTSNTTDTSKTTTTGNTTTTTTTSKANNTSKTRNTRKKKVHRSTFITNIIYPSDEDEDSLSDSSGDTDDSTTTACVPVETVDPPKGKRPRPSWGINLVQDWNNGITRYFPFTTSSSVIVELLMFLVDSLVQQDSHRTTQPFMSSGDWFSLLVCITLFSNDDLHLRSSEARADESACDGLSRTTPSSYFTSIRNSTFSLQQVLRYGFEFVPQSIETNLALFDKGSIRHSLHATKMTILNTIRTFLTMTWKALDTQPALDRSLVTMKAQYQQLDVSITQQYRDLLHFQLARDGQQDIYDSLYTYHYYNPCCDEHKHERKQKQFQHTMYAILRSRKPATIVITPEPKGYISDDEEDDDDDNAGKTSGKTPGRASGKTKKGHGRGKNPGKASGKTKKGHAHDTPIERCWCADPEEKLDDYFDKVDRGIIIAVTMLTDNSLWIVSNVVNIQPILAIYALEGGLPPLPPLVQPRTGKKKPQSSLPLISGSTTKKSDKKDKPSAQQSGAEQSSNTPRRSRIPEDLMGFGFSQGDDDADSDDDGELRPTFINLDDMNDDDDDDDEDEDEDEDDSANAAADLFATLTRAFAARDSLGPGGGVVQASMPRSIRNLGKRKTKPEPAPLPPWGELTKIEIPQDLSLKELYIAVRFHPYVLPSQKHRDNLAFTKRVQQYLDVLKFIASPSRSSMSIDPSYYKTIHANDARFIKALVLQSPPHHLHGNGNLELTARVLAYIASCSTSTMKISDINTAMMMVDDYLSLYQVFIQDYVTGSISLQYDPTGCGIVTIQSKKTASTSTRVETEVLQTPSSSSSEVEPAARAFHTHISPSSFLPQITPITPRPFADGHREQYHQGYSHHNIMSKYSYSINAELFLLRHLQGVCYDHNTMIEYLHDLDDRKTFSKATEKMSFNFFYSMDNLIYPVKTKKPVPIKPSANRIMPLFAPTVYIPYSKVHRQDLVYRKSFYHRLDASDLPRCGLWCASNAPDIHFSIFTAPFNTIGYQLGYLHSRNQSQSEDETSDATSSNDTSSSQETTSSPRDDEAVAALECDSKASWASIMTTQDRFAIFNMNNRNGSATPFHNLEHSLNPELCPVDLAVPPKVSFSPRDHQMRSFSAPSRVFRDDLLKHTPLDPKWIRTPRTHFQEPLSIATLEDNDPIAAGGPPAVHRMGWNVHILDPSFADIVLQASNDEFGQRSPRTNGIDLDMLPIHSIYTQTCRPEFLEELEKLEITLGIFHEYCTDYNRFQLIRNFIRLAFDTPSSSAASSSSRESQRPLILPYFVLLTDSSDLFLCAILATTHDNDGDGDDNGVGDDRDGRTPVDRVRLKFILLDVFPHALQPGDQHTPQIIDCPILSEFPKTKTNMLAFSLSTGGADQQQLTISQQYLMDKQTESMLHPHIHPKSYYTLLFRAPMGGISPPQLHDTASSPGSSSSSFAEDPHCDAAHTMMDTESLTSYQQYKHHMQHVQTAHTLQLSGTSSLTSAALLQSDYALKMVSVLNNGHAAMLIQLHIEESNHTIHKVHSTGNIVLVSSLSDENIHIFKLSYILCTSQLVKGMDTSVTPTAALSNAKVDINRWKLMYLGTTSIVLDIFLKNQLQIAGFVDRASNISPPTPNPLQKIMTIRDELTVRRATPDSIAPSEPHTMTVISRDRSTTSLIEDMIVSIPLPDIQQCIVAYLAQRLPLGSLSRREDYPSYEARKNQGENHLHIATKSLSTRILGLLLQFIGPNNRLVEKMIPSSSSSLVLQNPLVESFYFLLFSDLMLLTKSSSSSTVAAEQHLTPTSSQTIADMQRAVDMSQSFANHFSSIIQHVYDCSDNGDGSGSDLYTMWNAIIRPSSAESRMFTPDPQCVPLYHLLMMLFRLLVKAVATKCMESNHLPSKWLEALSRQTIMTANNRNLMYKYLTLPAKTGRAIVVHPQFLIREHLFKGIHQSASPSFRALHRMNTILCNAYLYALDHSFAEHGNQIADPSTPLFAPTISLEYKPDTHIVGFTVHTSPWVSVGEHDQNEHDAPLWSLTQPLQYHHGEFIIRSDVLAALSLQYHSASGPKLPSCFKRLLHLSIMAANGHFHSVDLAVYR